jgi:peroxiredoxin
VRWPVLVGVGGLVAAGVGLIIVLLWWADVLHLPGASQAVTTMRHMSGSVSPPGPAGPAAHPPAGLPVVGAPAPEIAGEDLDGRPFKLSDFRGKVVALDFWADFSFPCQSAYSPHRRLVRRLENKPFVLVGVNCDPDRQHALEVIREEKLTWRSWWDSGSKAGGPIARNWRLRQLPTTYVLDAQGVIRFKHEGLAEDKALNQEIDGLLRQVAPQKPPG